MVRSIAHGGVLYGGVLFGGVLFLGVSSVAGRGGWATGDGCTSIIVGPGGAAGGGTMTTHTDDCMECDFRISKVPAATHPKGAMRSVYRYRSQYPRYLGYDRGLTYFPENTDTSIHDWKVGEGDFAPIGEIPQVEHTHAFVDGGYGIMNEFQVSIGESTCGSVLTALPVYRGGHALLEAGELSRLALERCKTAKCAVETMGSLAEEHGYYGADETEGEGGESLQVVDPSEAWVFHIVADDTGKSAVWAAQKVPAGHVAAVANQFVIRTVNLTDTANFMGSANMLEVAERAGLWDGAVDGKHVDFTAAFSMDRGHLSPYATRRVWRVMTLAAPSLADALPAKTTTFADDYPFSVPVDAPLQVRDILVMNRDHYEGTPFDMTKGIASGPYGDPSRFDPGQTHGLAYGEDDGGAIDDKVAWSGSFERAISIYRCSYSWVSQARPHVADGLGVVWFGQYAPHASQYVPIYLGGSKVPAAFSTGSLFKFDPAASYWVHAAIGNWADRLYVHTIGDIQAKQAEVEDALFAAQVGVEAGAGPMLQWAPEGEAAAFLDEVSDTASLADLDVWGQFLYVLIAKFKDGQRLDGPPGEVAYAEKVAPTKLFYPKWWLDQVGFFDSDDDGALEGGSLEQEVAKAMPSVTSLVLVLVVSHLFVAWGVALAVRKPTATTKTATPEFDDVNLDGDDLHGDEAASGGGGWPVAGSNIRAADGSASFGTFAPRAGRGGYTTIATTSSTSAVEMTPRTRRTYQQQARQGGVAGV